MRRQISVCLLTGEFPFDAAFCLVRSLLPRGHLRSQPALAADPPGQALRFEWKIAPGTDIGVFYRPGAYEYRIIDNQHRGRLKHARWAAGALYGCVGPEKDLAKPVGEWNEGAIVCRGTSIEHWLNGEKVVALDYAKPEWAPIVEAFQKRQRADLAARGRFLTLKDHQGPVWYRNIRLRKLD